MDKTGPDRVSDVGDPKAIIESVEITWCSRRRHARRKVSVDLTAVSGIIWRHPLGLPVKPVGPHPPLDPVPHTRLEELGPCEGLPALPGEAPERSDSSSGQPALKSMRASSSASNTDDFCWWDGNQWICPTDVDQ